MFIAPCRAAAVSGRPTYVFQHAQCHYENADASQGDVTAAIAQLEDIDRRQTRIYGAAHPQTDTTRFFLAEAREKLAHLE